LAQRQHTQSTQTSKPAKRKKQKAGKQFATPRNGRVFTVTQREASLTNINLD